MSKTNCVWHFDKTPLKENHFFSSCVTVGEKSTINILRCGNRIPRRLGGSLLINMKVGKWRTWAKRIYKDETWRERMLQEKPGTDRLAN